MQTEREELRILEEACLAARTKLIKAIRQSKREKWSDKVYMGEAQWKLDRKSVV